jgi:hypothetical protein
MAAVLEFNESKPARTTGLSVDGQYDLGRRGYHAKIRPQVGFGSAVREVTYEQADGQSNFS